MSGVQMAMCANCGGAIFYGYGGIQYSGKVCSCNNRIVAQPLGPYHAQSSLGGSPVIDTGWNTLNNKLDAYVLIDPKLEKAIYEILDLVKEIYGKPRTMPIVGSPNQTTNGEKK